MITFRDLPEIFFDVAAYSVGRLTGSIYHETIKITGVRYDRQFDCNFFEFVEPKTRNKSSLGEFAFPSETKKGDEITFTLSGKGTSRRIHGVKISKRALTH